MVPSNSFFFRYVLSLHPSLNTKPIKHGHANSRQGPTENTLPACVRSPESFVCLQ